MDGIQHRTRIIVMAALLVLGAPAAQAQCQPQSTGNKAVVGTVLGAVVGGLLGSQIGGGDGRKVAIGAGVLAGGFLGNQLGAQLDCRDLEYHQQTTQNALETQRAGSTSSWRNPDTGHAGSITPVRTYQQADGTYCRDFDQSIEVDGRIEHVTGTACRQPDGTWRMQG